MRAITLLGGLCLLVWLSGCTYNPTREQSPELNSNTWKSLQGEPGYQISPELATTLDERGIPANLKLSGKLYFVASSFDENGAARIESLIRLQRAHKHDQVQAVKRLNHLVYHNKDYRFLKLSASYWRKKVDNNSPDENAGFYLMHPQDMRSTNNTPYEFIRSEPAMQWQPIQPMADNADDTTQATKTDRIVERIITKRQGAVNAYMEANAETGVKFALNLPVDLVQEVMTNKSAIYLQLSLGEAFRAGKAASSPEITLKGTLALRNPKIDDTTRVITPAQRTQVGLDRIGPDRIYSDHILANDVSAIANYRQSLLETLEQLLADDQQASEQWETTIKKLRPLQRDVGDFILEATPTELAYLMPAIAQIEESQAGEVLPNGEATILNGPNGQQLTVKTGDIAVRLGTSRQIAVGTFPLPKVLQRDDDGFVTAMEMPGAKNSYTLFKMFFSDPRVQPQIKPLLGPLWEKVPDDIRQAISQASAEQMHPFLSPSPDANKVFLTVLDHYIDMQIRKETALSYVNDYWETELDNEYWPSVINAKEEFTSIELDDVLAMRGQDGADLREALAMRKNIAAYQNTDSPFDLELTNADALNNIPYWPGTPILSHVGIIVVEKVNDQNIAVVYDAYPGEGLMRKPFSQFFGTAEAAMGAVLRYDGPEEHAAGIAATEIVELYKTRWNLKRLSVHPSKSGNLASEVLLSQDEAAPPTARAQAWDSFDYAFDWRNQTRYSCSELVWAHYARNGVNLVDSFSMLLAPVVVAQDKLGWNVEVMIQASPQALILSDKLRRVADFDSEAINDYLVAYSQTGNSQTLDESAVTKEEAGGEMVPTVWLGSVNSL